MGTLLEQARSEQAYLSDLRRELHRCPELAMQETRTAAVIERELDRLDIPHTRIGPTGVLGVLWGTGTGGGTVALYMANRNIETLDAGTPVLAMHSPFEVTSKLDCYMTYRAMKAVFED